MGAGMPGCGVTPEVVAQQMMCKIAVLLSDGRHLSFSLWGVPQYASNGVVHAICGTHTSVKSLAWYLPREVSR